MKLVVADRVQETTTTTGTGTLTLAGAVTGFQTFAVVGNGNRCRACVFAVDGDGIPTGDWETFIGVYTVSGTTLSRVTVKESSNGNAAVSFSAGTKRVILTPLASDAMDAGMGAFLGDMKPRTPGSFDEEFEGTADTLPTDWAFTSAPSGSDATFINSRWPSLLTVEGTGDASYTLTRSNFTPGAGDFGIWWKTYIGPAAASSKADLRIYLYNAGLTEGRAWNMDANTSNVSFDARGLKTVSSVESLWTGTGKSLDAGNCMMYGGITRTAADSYKLYFSNNGVAWQKMGASETHSFTVDKIVFKIATAAEQALVGLDWIRYRTDLLFPRIG